MVNIGKVGWKLAMDAYPYRQQNECLVEAIKDLLSQWGCKALTTTTLYPSRVSIVEWLQLANAWHTRTGKARTH